MIQREFYPSGRRNQPEASAATEMGGRSTICLPPTINHDTFAPKVVARTHLSCVEPHKMVSDSSPRLAAPTASTLPGFPLSARSTAAFEPVLLSCSVLTDQLVGQIETFRFTFTSICDEYPRRVSATEASGLLRYV